MRVVTSALAVIVAVVFAGPARAEPVKQDELKITVQANSVFAFDLYRELIKSYEGESVFFSPYSISIALAMTAEGARGRTAQEMGEALRYPAELRGDGDEAWRMATIHSGLGRLNALLSGEADEAKTAATRKELEELREQLAAMQQKMNDARDFNMERAQDQQKLADRINELASQIDPYELSVANALWGEQTYPFKQDFIDTISKAYKTGGVFPVDFINDFDGAKKRIDGWCAKQTHERITEIVPKLSRDEAKLMRLILTNAIYFKGEWSQPFEERNTQPRGFKLGSGQTVETPIMFAASLDVARYGAFNADGTFFNSPARMERGQKDGLYPGPDGFAIVELPYKGDDLSMVVIAPNSANGLEELERTLTAERVGKWIEQLERRDVDVYLPKFTLETKYKLNDQLQAMGMVRAFVAPELSNGADFSGMSASSNPLDKLYISFVMHKAFVEVNEKGTEAAAVTAGGMVSLTGLPMTVPFIPEFKADRPFVYLIREKSTGSVLFLGRMTKPQ